MPGPGKLPSLETPRLALRWLREDDIDDLFAIFGDPEVMRFWSTPPYASRDDVRALLASIRDGFERARLFQWGVERKEDHRVIGTTTLARIDRANRRAEIGFALGRAHWGQGYAQEAVTAVLDHAFDALALHRIEADVDPHNAASLCTLERLGFEREGYLRERWQVGGATQDSVILGLLRSGWRPR